MTPKPDRTSSAATLDLSGSSPVKRINEGLTEEDLRQIDHGIATSLGCVSRSEGTPGVGTEEGCG